MYRRTGKMMPDNGLKQLEGFDAIFFGAVGAPDIPDHITLWELRLAICQGFDQYANVRPTRLLPGVRGPLREDLGRQIDWVIVRENSEGEYAGVGGRAHRGLPIEVAMDVAVFTRDGVARICRHACEVAMSRPRKLLTVVTKSNAQRQRHGDVGRGLRRGHRAVSRAHRRQDAGRCHDRAHGDETRHDRHRGGHQPACRYSVGPRLRTGGVARIGATGNIDPQRRRPSMFEPIHGSAFDITGKGIANPLGSFWTAAMMLEHLGEAPAAQRLMRAVEAVTARGDVLTPDLGGSATTEQVTQAVIAALSGANT